MISKDHFVLFYMVIFWVVLFDVVVKYVQDSSNMKYWMQFYGEKALQDAYLPFNLSKYKI